MELVGYIIAGSIFTAMALTILFEFIQWLNKKNKLKFKRK